MMSTITAVRLLTRTLTLGLGLLAVVSGALVATEDAGDGFRPIFNGHDLNGWDADSSFWSVRDGAITGESSATNQPQHSTFCIWKDGEVDDFELKATVKLVGGNSGIQFRSQRQDEWAMSGYQADVDDTNHHDWTTGALFEEDGRGMLAKVGDNVQIATDGKATRTGDVGSRQQIIAAFHPQDWNSYDILATGSHIVVKINGVVTSELTDNQTDKRALFGKLGLQLNAGSPTCVVQFKDISLKRLKLSDNRKKIILIAGEPSHGPGEHEFVAGVWCMRKCLDKVPSVVAADYYHGWPADPTAFDNADAVWCYSDGGGGHPLLQGNRLQVIGALVDKGVGFGCSHYAVEVPNGQASADWLAWIGGYYENQVSANPVWTADFTHLPEHAVTRGVKPFSTRDEWYFNIHFRPDFKLDVPMNTPGVVQPILTAAPSDEVRAHPYSGSGPFAQVVAEDGRTEVMMWVLDNPNGHRGFGFTGGHYHKNWANPDQRKLILNALLWIAHAEVPAQGVESNPTEEELNSHLRSRLAGGGPADGGAVDPKKALYASDVVRHGMVDVDVDITGAKKLYLVVGDGGDGYSSDWADWIDPVVVGPAGTVNLTDMTWVSATTGWGSAHLHKNVNGGEMKVAGKPVDGIGVHAQSIIIYNIAGKGFTRFKAKGGVDNGGTDQNGGASTSVQFMVFTKAP